jgi:hypothetical protein
MKKRGWIMLKKLIIVLIYHRHKLLELIQEEASNVATATAIKQHDTVLNSEKGKVHKR